MLMNTGAAFQAYFNRPDDPPRQEHRRETLAAAEKFPRVVWFVFDEFDYGLAFAQRRSGVSLPTLDRLRNESVFATEVYPPGLWTMDGLFSYLTGQPYREVRVTGSSQVLLFPSPSGEEHPFRVEDSVLAKLEKQGARMAFVGWYHPYCRLLAEISLDCFWEPNADSNDQTLLAESFARYGYFEGTLQLFREHPFVPFLPTGQQERIKAAGEELKLRTASQQHSEALTRLMSQATEAARNPSYDFVFVHIPLPHPPGPAPAETARMVSRTGVAYLDNLMRLDGFLSDVRAAMESSGVWNSSHVIVSSDHPLRHSVWSYRPEWVGSSTLLSGSDRGRVPLLVKLQNQTTGRQFEQPFSSILLHDLSLALFAGEMQSTGDLTAWLSANRKRFPTEWPVKTVSGRQF
jgi:hypothetical protein